MNKTMRSTSILALVIVFTLLAMFFMMNTGVAFADDGDAAAGGTMNKALASAIAIGLVGACAAIAMGISSAKTSESIARQPEAEGKIRTTFMLGLIFIETVAIYALLVVILIIFVL